MLGSCLFLFQEGRGPHGHRVTQPQVAGALRAGGGAEFSRRAGSLPAGDGENFPRGSGLDRVD